ncbi:MAG: hydroxyacid dehydrogenase [Ruminococcaceae bacterium]|nr:hydroxyacid dehydrogenase [Oscillospiraceae bacterium]
MKAIFLANRKATVDYVYTREAKDRLKKLVDIDVDKVYCQEDLEANPNGFSDVDYIFSTWSMPGGTEDKDDFAKYFPNVKALFYAAGSVKYFGQHYLDKNIRLFSAFAANAIPVAEFTMAQILLANKGYFQSVRMVRRGHYDRAVEYSKSHTGNYDSKIGIIGAGMIGRKVIELLKDFSLNFYVYDEFMPQSAVEALGAKKATLEEIFSECDVVSNHLANVPATVGIFKEEHFRLMKPNTVFINTGRGAQVDEAGFLKVLRERRDICALLDVTVDEPPLEGSDFYKLDNIFLTPHIAGSQANEVGRMAEYMIDEFERVLTGEQTQYEITKEKFEKMA